MGSPVRCVCTSISPGKHVALDRSITDDPVAALEAAGPTAVIIPFPSNAIIWSASIRLVRTSSSFPQRTAPGAATASGAATAAITNESISRVLRIKPPSVVSYYAKPCSIHPDARLWKMKRALFRQGVDSVRVNGNDLVPCPHSGAGGD